VTAAAGHVPLPLLEQLKPGGRIVIPIGQPFETQQMVVVSKGKDGQVRDRTVLPVVFVPMTGRVQEGK
jgi:protein-L-isoaspartate(D-aspartate) O-methyltransferase